MAIFSATKAELQKCISRYLRWKVSAFCVFWGQRRFIEKVGGKTERNSVLKDLKEKQMAASEKPVDPREDKILSSKSRGGNEL